MKRVIISLFLSAWPWMPTSLWAAEDGGKWLLAGRLYGDTKARRVGDLLTVEIVEETSSSREADTKTTKKTDLSGSLSFTRPNVDNQATAWTNVSLPSFSAEASRSFEGGGTMKNEEKITSTMTVRVMEVLPNGNLLVEGKRSLDVQGETSGYMLSGTVRPTDISRENIIPSTAIADLNIRYFSAGSLAKSQKKGLFNSLIDWVNPF